MIQILIDLFNTCLRHRQVPKVWKNALIVLIQIKEIHQTSKLQTNQLVSHNVQGVVKHSSTKNNSYPGLPPTT